MNPVMLSPHTCTTVKSGARHKPLARLLLASLLLSATSFVAAQNVLIRNATVHTAGTQGTLRGADVLVQNGKIGAVGANLAAPAGVSVIDAEGRPLTPTLFGGISHIGLEEVSGESSTVDARLALGADSKQVTVRPEFDVTLAYNPESVVIPVTRIEGIGWTLLSADTGTGGSILSGQGGVVRLDGGPDPIGARALFLHLGAEASELSGGSRAAQWMLLDQLIDEARGQVATNAQALLTPAGRATLSRYLDGGGRIVVSINRAADIRQLLRWSARHKLRIGIAGGAEAWKLARELAAAQVPVFVDPLANLPGSFDSVGASMANAARLRAAGVAVGFSQSGDASHNARKIRQAAGNAVAAGLPWEDGLAGLTSVPADTLGIADQVGRIAPGQRADLVLWTGDPLDVASVASQVWMDGRAIPMRSRQTELRDRYMAPLKAGDLPRAYPRRASAD